MKQSNVIFRLFLLVLIAGWLLPANDTAALEHEFSGQLSGWTIQSENKHVRRNQSGARYVPQLTLEHNLSQNTFADIELALNGFAAYDSENSEGDADLELYRLKLRYATPQTETRLGLQRLNFGPAHLLRSLQWFDQIDPRDPLQLTDGVYALRFTYSALNNASLRLWGLYGNDERKGYEQLASVKDTPGFGGRLQYPLFNGELAATAHTRKVDASRFGKSNFREERYALDGRWEKVIGLWFESVAQHQQASFLPHTWTHLTTLGADYTFGIGNGLHVIAEHLATFNAETAFGAWEDDAHVSAFSLSYPFGLFDTFSAIGSYAWETEKYSQYISWQRAYNAWTLNLSLFSYPDTSAQENGFQRATAVSGYGAQVMAIYYH